MLWAYTNTLRYLIWVVIGLDSDRCQLKLILAGKYALASNQNATITRKMLATFNKRSRSQSDAYKARLDIRNPL